MPRASMTLMASPMLGNAAPSSAQMEWTGMAQNFLRVLFFFVRR